MFVRRVRLTLEKSSSDARVAKLCSTAAKNARSKTGKVVTRRRAKVRISARDYCDASHVVLFPRGRQKSLQLVSDVSLLVKAPRK